jgi:hypothetical protein
MIELRRSVSARLEGEGSDDTVGETSEKSLAESVPGEGSALGILSLGTFYLSDGFSFNDANGSLRLTHEVEDLDALVCTDGDPLELRIECDLVDGGTSVEFSGRVGEVEDIPDEEFLVFATCSEVLSVGGDGKIVNVGLVSLERVSDLEVSVPNLESAVPAD